jgi:hypothetical protein
MHWNELRGDLLNDVPQREIMDKYVTQCPFRGFIGLLPTGLHQWTKHSRRVFHLSEELLTLLSLTSLDGLNWKNVPWPFSSFLVTLEMPLIGKTGVPYDAILVHRWNLGEGEALIITLFSSELERYHTITSMDRDRLRRLYRIGRYEKVITQLIAKSKQYDAMDMKLIGMALPPGFDDRPVEESCVDHFQRAGLESLLKEGVGVDVSVSDAACRIAVGLCLYLTTLPNNGGEHCSPWERAVPQSEKKRDPHAISNEALVCTVTSIYKFSAEERETVEALRGCAHAEMCAHFRRGHWRRPPGKGNDPEASKTVWVRPTLVRKNRLKPGEVPGGALVLG